MEKRSSNIELLRIILISMVILIHSLSSTITKIINNNVNYVAFVGLYVFARPAVNVFILISSYFLYDKVDFDYRKIYRKIWKKIAVPIVWYIPIILLYGVVLQNKKLGITRSIILNMYNLISVNGLFFHLWYMVCYVVLLLLMPYLNIIIKQTTKKQHIMLIIFSSIIFVLLSSINDLVGMKVCYGYTGKSFTDMGVFNFITFIILYLIGGYIGKYGLKIKFPIMKYMAVSILVTILTLLYSYNITPVNIAKKFLLKKHIIGYFQLYQCFLKYNNIFILIMSVLLFIFFLNLKIVNNKYINKIAGYVQGAYIIHMVVLSAVFKLFFLNVEYPYYTQTIESVIKLICVVIATLIMSLFIEYIRKELIEKIVKHYSKIL